MDYSHNRITFDVSDSSPNVGGSNFLRCCRQGLTQPDPSVFPGSAAETSSSLYLLIAA